MDSAFLIAGALTAGLFFYEHTADEIEIRDLADKLYLRVNWQWAQNGEATLTHGWRPESGFLKYRWEGYDEALLLYILALGSPTYPLSESSYSSWCSTYRWLSSYGYDYLYSGSLFTHQLSHVWIDFRGIQDEFMRGKGIDYFENSRRATYVQQKYAIENPLKFKGYRDCCWGLTASDGPGPDTIKIDGIEREFFNYLARGVPFGPDDGTIAPWAVAASLPFAPEIVLPALDYCIHQAKLTELNSYGFKASFNPTHPGKVGNPFGYWVSPWHYGLNQGPIVLMIENYRSELIWRLMRSCPHIIRGLRRADFKGGWLFSSKTTLSIAGIGFVLLGALSSGAGRVILKKVSNSDFPTLTQVAQFSFAAILLFAVSFVKEGVPEIKFNFIFSVSLILLALGTTALADVLLIDLLKRNSLSKLSVYMFLTPAFSIVLAIIFFKEKFGIWESLGIALILIGVVLGFVRKPANRTSRLKSGVD